MWDEVEALDIVKVHPAEVLALYDNLEQHLRDCFHILGALCRLEAKHLRVHLGLLPTEDFS